MIKTGKPPKVALTALMRKLIELANALIKADRKWEEKELDQDGILNLCTNNDGRCVRSAGWATLRNECEPDP